MLTKKTNVLGDGSRTYDVVISDFFNNDIVGQVELHACSQAAAEHLIRALRNEINTFTVEVVETK